MYPDGEARVRFHAKVLNNLKSLQKEKASLVLQAFWQIVNLEIRDFKD
jgi:mRNA-degrading endonuclease RelE of RelBE toxin-antitoxin system